jgi:hypothetical protein
VVAFFAAGRLAAAFLAGASAEAVVVVRFTALAPAFFAGALAFLGGGSNVS